MTVVRHRSTCFIGLGKLVAEKIDFLSRPKAAAGDVPEPVERDDKVDF